MLDKKQIWVIFFLFEFKMGCKAAETTHNITNAFDPGTANERTVQGWLKEETRALRMSSTVAGHQKVTTTQSHHSKLMLLQIHKKLPKNSTSTTLWSFGIWSKLERWKTSRSWYLTCMCTQSLQLCLTLWDSMDRSPPGSSVHGILQSRILEWVAMPSSRWSS